MIALLSVGAPGDAQAPGASKTKLVGLSCKVGSHDDMSRANLWSQLGLKDVGISLNIVASEENLEKWRT